jgi:hypothetical protein
VTKKWYRAVMKTDLMMFKNGDDVLTIESTIQHAHPSMGTSHWIMGRDGRSILLVNDAEFGMGLSALMRMKAPVDGDKQEKCTEKAKELLKDSVYAPKNRYQHTYLYGKEPDHGTRPSRSKRPNANRSGRPQGDRSPRG